MPQLQERIARAMERYQKWEESKHPRNDSGEFTNKDSTDDSVESARIDYAENGTKSKAFRAWFGDSKVVDSSGEPQETHGTAKPVFHGTPHDFEAFDNNTKDWSCEVGKGFYFTDNEELAKSEYSKGGKVIAAYLKIDKPLDLDKPISDSDRDSIMEAGKKRFKHVEWSAPSGLTGDGIHRWIDDQIGSAFVNDVIESAGFDGITHIARNKLGGRDKKKTDDFGRVWIAFAPSQIKSTDNRGTFDQKDDRMKYSRVQSVLERYSKESGEKKKHKFSSTQIDAPEELASKIREYAKRIPDEDLAEDGREDDIHVTVKYGLHTDDVEEVRKAVAGYGPFKIVLGDTSLFENEDADVLMITIPPQRDARNLFNLNHTINEKCECTTTHKDYRPHITIAYLRPGRGKKWTNSEPFTGESFEATEIQFSDKHREKTAIPLGRESGPVQERIERAKSKWDESRVSRRNNGQIKRWRATSDRPLFVDFQRDSEMPDPDNYSRAKRIVETYGKKPAGGQRSMFDEEDHPRADDGKFVEKGSTKLVHPDSIDTWDMPRVDSQKKLVDSMKQDGWSGRPIIGVRQGDRVSAITGSQRVAAAKSIGIDVPVHEVTLEDWKQASKDAGFKSADANDKSLANYDRLMILRMLKDPTASQIMEDETVQGRRLGDAFPKITELQNNQKRRVFSLELKKGSQQSDDVRLIHDDPFDGSQLSGDGKHHRVLPMQEAVKIINDDIKNGRGSRPLTRYVESFERVGVPGMQKNLFDEEPSGQKKLFDYIAPKKTATKSKQEDLLAGVNARLKEQIKKKETLSPADPLTNVTHEPISGQRDLFDKRFDIAKERFNRT